MKIIINKTHNPFLKIIVPRGELTGNGALTLQDCIFSFFDVGGYYLLIDLGHVKKIDGLGIEVMEQFLDRGIGVRLFNVGAHIRRIISLSGKATILKMIYNESSIKNAVSLFEKEILKEKNKAGDGIRNRHYPRIDTHIPAEFKYHPGHNGVISARANIINLSEGGALADQIIATNTTTGKLLNNPDIEGQELYDMRFKLNDDSAPIEASGKCMRVFRNDETLNAGICFKEVSNDDKLVIEEYVKS